MKPIRLVCILTIAASATSASARDPEPAFPERIELSASDSADSALIKLGEYRYVYRLFFKLYDVALYLTPGTSFENVLGASTSYRLQFRYLREIDKSIILESSDKMLRKNLSSQEYEQIAERVERINRAYRTVRDGDRSSLTYQPGTGTTLRINGEPIVMIKGEDFARLYFKIWLGEEPISSTLRESVLGLAE